MANALGRALGPAQDALSNPTGTTPQMSPIPRAAGATPQADGLPAINPGLRPTKQLTMKNAKTNHGTSGFETVAGALADKLHKVRGR